MGKLHKKWRSTSDFDSAPGLSVYKRPSLSFRPGSALGSQLQLQGLDKQQREARYRHFSVTKYNYLQPYTGTPPSTAVRREW